jgi:hypothetical protein
LDRVARIHGWVPEASWFAEHAVGPLGVPIAVGMGVPRYSNAAGVLPLVEALHDKGMQMGTVLAFMMSVVALSLPEMILLRQGAEAQADRHVHRRGRRGHPRHRVLLQRCHLIESRRNRHGHQDARKWLRQV